MWELEGLLKTLQVRLVRQILLFHVRVLAQTRFLTQVM
jgi:hypothetical protein